VARAAVSGGLISGPRPWHVATIAAVTDETATARTLMLDVPGWPGHLPGQHADVRLTAADGYSAQRSYSIASAPSPGRLELTVQRLEDGEVSPYLAGIAEPGDQFDLRGPIGGWFTWSPPGLDGPAGPAGPASPADLDGPAAPVAPAAPGPESARLLQLLAGGSGIVPLMSMVRAHGAAKSQVPVGLIYSARSPSDVIYGSELSERTLSSPLSLTLLYTRAAHRGVPPGRINAATIAVSAFPPDTAPDIFVCGPSGFVEAVTSLLVEAGHAPASIRTERFGPTGT
jgi:ferredoxin-NADP reductase